MGVAIYMGRGDTLMFLSIGCSFRVLFASVHMK